MSRLRALQLHAELYIAVFVVFGAFAYVNTAFISNGQMATIWISCACTIAIFLKLGKRFWPSIFFAAVLLNLTLDRSWYVATFLAASVTTEGLFGSYIYNTILNRPTIIHGLARTYAVTVAALLSTFVGASLISIGLTTNQHLNSEFIVNAFQLRWATRSVGVLTILPIFLRLYDSQYVQRLFEKRARIQIAGLVVVVFAASAALVHWTSYIAEKIGNVLLVQGLVAASAITAMAVYDISKTLKSRRPIIFLVCGWIGCVILLFILPISLNATAIALIPLLFGFGIANVAALRSHTDQITRSTNEELRDLNNRWSAFMRSAPVGVFLTDNKGHSLYANRAYQKFFDRELHELTGTGWLNFIHPAERVEVHHEWNMAIKERRLFSKVCRVIRPDRQEAWANLTVDRIAEDQNLSFIGFLTDLTELKKQEALVIHASRLATLGEMAGGIAHEINTPLGIISGKAHIIQKSLMAGNIDRDKILKDAEKIDATSQRIAKIIRGLRTFSRSSENENFVHSTVHNIIGDTLELCREKLNNHDIDLRLESSKDVELESRPTQVAQVLLNLLNNSFDAVVNTESPWIEVGYTTTNNSVIISVTDSGHGIPEEVRERVMQPFFTTKDIGSGTGLGLSIAKGLVEGHGGRLWYDETCINTRFCFEIPLKQNSAS